MVTYRATLDVPRALVAHVARLLWQHRRTIGTRRGRRRLTCFWQAVLVLRWFRDHTRVAQLARDHGISPATGYRYLHEGIDVIAATAPDLHDQLAGCAAADLSHLVLDGTLIATDRVAVTTDTDTHQWYNGHRRRFGATIQVLASPDGYPVWVSTAEPGSTHDLTAAHTHLTGALYWAASHLHLPTLADKAYTGAGIGIHTPYRHPSTSQLTADHRTYNRLHAATRALGERAIAVLTTRWPALTRITLCPQRASAIAQAALALTHYEHSRHY